MKIDVEALDFASREAFAALRHTNAPRQEKLYAPHAIMKYNEDHAKLVVLSYIKKVGETGFVHDLIQAMDPEEKRRLLKQLLEEQCN